MKFLIADDDSITAEDLKLQLADLGHTIVGVVDNGDHLLTTLQQTQPDWVFLDPTLKGKSSGTELAQMLRDEIQIPFLFLTSGSENVDSDLLQSTRPLGYLFKPFQEYQIRATLDSASESFRKEKELLQLQSQLKEYQDRARTSQLESAEKERVQSMGLMAAGVAHNFNNLLTPILGYCDLLVLESQSDLTPSPHTLKAYLDRIKYNTRQAAWVIERLLRFASPGKLNACSSPVFLHDIASQALANTQPLRDSMFEDRNINIRIQPFLEPLPAIMGNEGELRDAIQNVILNAMEAIRGSGVITLKTWIHENRVFLAVEDTGVGMSEHVIKHCFDPFFSTKNGVDIGLGLTMAFSTMERHGGKIIVKSQVGHGTRFEFRLPIPATSRTQHSSPEKARMESMTSVETPSNSLENMLR